MAAAHLAEVRRRANEQEALPPAAAALDLREQPTMRPDTHAPRRGVMEEALRL